MKKISIVASLIILFMSCEKNSCVCTQKQSAHDEKIMNGTIASNTEKAKYKYTIGEKAMKPDGSMITYTKEYIEQQKSDLEATNEFDCEWK